MNILLELIKNDNTNSSLHRFKIYPNILIGINEMQGFNYWFCVWFVETTYIKIFETNFTIINNCININGDSIMLNRFKTIKTKQDLDKFIDNLIKIEVFK